MRTQSIFTLFFVIMFLVSFVSVLSRGDLRASAGSGWPPPILPNKAVQIKVGVIIGNEVFSYDDFQKVEVSYQDVMWDSSLTEPFVATSAVLQWFVGDLSAKTIRPAPLPSRIGNIGTRQVGNGLFNLQWGDERIQRWCYKDGSFWCIPGRLVLDEIQGQLFAYNAQLPFLYRTPHKEPVPIDGINESRSSGQRGLTLFNDITREEWVPAVSNSSQLARRRQFTEEYFQMVSSLPPIPGDNHGPPYYCYISDGFDFCPISRNHWQFYTLIPSGNFFIPSVGEMQNYFPFTVWEAQCKMVERDGVTGYENKWTVLSQSLLPWGGNFFAVPIKNADGDFPSFHLIRDSAPCFDFTKDVLAQDIQKSYTVSGELYRLDVAEEDIVNEDNGPRHWGGDVRWGDQKIHCEKPILDSEKYRLIALIYVEPEGKVYGFGRGFYVRLDMLPENGDLASAIVPCRDVTQGKIFGTDASGIERPLGEPFRTVWECALVLQGGGLLEK